MGCANSKQKRCRHCQAPHSPVPRSYSMHVVHPPQQKGDSYHVVALTSTTLGSLALDSANHKEPVNGSYDIVTPKGKFYDTQEMNGYSDHAIENGVAVNGVNNEDFVKSKASFSMGLIEAKTWSTMIQEKIPKVAPKTPVRTPPGEPEMINTWELMAGLEDNSSPVNLPHRFRSFSFDVSRDPSPVPESPKLSLEQTKPPWLENANREVDTNSPEFDLEIISTFRQSLQELSPSHPFYIKPISNIEQQVKGNAKPGKDKVVVYFTSLRGVRKTYEDCCHVRVILKGLGVRIDDRDLSMHSGFKEELRELLGEGFVGGGLPRVFIGRKYIGGPEEIRRLHEEGQLEKLVYGCEMVDDGGGRCGGGACEACGDIRFVPCETCSGSCKIYYEGDEVEDLQEEEEVSGEIGFQRCPDCNENGLIRCPICCD